MNETLQRQHVIHEAKSWLRTPFAHRGKVKGAGVDCAVLAIAVYQACWLVPAAYEPPPYKMDWHLHHGHHWPSGQTYRGHEEHALEDCAEEVYLREVLKLASPAGTPTPGCLALFQFGRAYAHGAIVLMWPLLVHASRIARCVSLGDGERDGELLGRRPRFFTVWSE